MLDDLEQADEAGQVAFTRYLCEEFLNENPNHWPTLIRYASCLTDLSLYDIAREVIVRAEWLA